MIACVYKEIKVESRICSKANVANTLVLYDGTLYIKQDVQPSSTYIIRQEFYIKMLTK